MSVVIIPPLPNPRPPPPQNEIKLGHKVHPSSVKLLTHHLHRQYAEKAKKKKQKQNKTLVEKESTPSINQPHF